MKGRKLLFSLLTAIMVIASSLFVVSCKKDKGFTAHGEEGVYYAYDNSGNEINALLEKGTIAYTTDEIINGTYSYDGKTFTYTIGESTQTADYDGNTIRLTVNGQTRIFYRKSVKYSVKYHVDGNVYKTDSVTNGSKAVRPDDPVKSGSKFIGWYETNDYKNVHNFAALVTENVDLYGYFVDNAIVEYSVTLNAEGTEYDKQRITTTGGVIRDLPVPDKKDGKNFSGWYVSDYNSADKLTYKYDGRQLSSDVELFAAYENGKPEVTLDKNGKFTWKNKAGVTYTAEVFLVEKSGEKSVHTQSDMTGTVEFDFGNQPAGDYRISVKEGENETSVYYKNKALARVSGFKVVDNKTLIFNSVENAAEYKISVDCGTSGHVHEKDSLGKNTVYNFASCGMKKGGIEFTVYAVADGYLTSESKYVFERSLEGVADVKYEEKTGYIVWTRVDNAVSYEVSVAAGKESPFVFTTNETRYSLKKFTGEITVKVTPVTDGFNSPEAVAFSFTKNTLSTPSAIRVANNKITWDAVNDASSYVITVNGAAKTVTSNEYALSQEEIADKATVKVTVQAIHSSVIGNNSFVSDEVLIGLTAFGAAPVYDAGVVTWSPVAKADKYEVYLNNAAAPFVTITDGKTFAPVTFDKSGNNKITVKAYESDKEKADDYAYLTEVSVTVKAYKVTLDVRGGTDVENQYYAYGDVVSFPSTEYYGYDLTGWFDVPGGAADNGALYTDGSSFMRTSDVILYAYWSPAKVAVVLDTMGVGKLDDKYYSEDNDRYEVTVRYGESFTLPVPVEGSYVSSSSFGGWYTEPNKHGERYTVETGAGLKPWLDVISLRLFPAWYETLTYTKIYNPLTNKQDDAYAVSQGPDINAVTTLKIPAVYTDGKPVLVIGADAFSSCTKLKELSVPDTIYNIDTGYVTSEGDEISAFTSCNNLEKVEVYHVEGNNDIYYSSISGVLFREDETNGKELRYVPAALKPSDEENAILSTYKVDGVTYTRFTVPTGVTSLPLNAFSANGFTSIVIPYTVTNVEAKAFASGKISEIFFLDTPADKKSEEKPLVFASDNVFSGCGAQTIILPSRTSAETDFTAIFGNGNALSTAGFKATNLKALGFSGEGGAFGVLSLNEKIKATIPGTDTDVLCGIVVDKSDASAQKIVYSPNAYFVSEKDSDNNLVIPEYISEIGNDAFKGAKFNSVAISFGVTKIGARAFYSFNTTAITIGESEQDGKPLEICDNAFESCKATGKVIFPSRTASIGESAFASTGINEVVFNSDDKSNAELRIGKNAFYNSKIASVSFGASLKSIAGGAFYNTGVSSVTLDCGEADIEEGAFFDLNTPFNAGVNTLVIGKNTGYMKLAAAFGANMNEIRINAENRNYRMTDGSVVYIVNGEEKSSLSEGETADITYNVNGIVFNGDGTALVIYPRYKSVTNYKTPDVVTAIEDFAFVDGNNISNAKISGTLTIGKNVVTIGKQAFSSSMAANIEFEKETAEGVSEKPLDIGYRAFRLMRKVTSLTIPGRVVKIGEEAFADSETLSKIVVEEGVQVIEDNAFGGTLPYNSSKALEEVRLPSTLTSIGMSESGLINILTRSPKMKTLEIAAGEKYATFGKVTYSLRNENGVNVADKILYLPVLLSGDVVIKNTISEISSSAFKGINGINEITFEGGKVDYLTEIGAEAFSGCTGIKSIVLPEGLTGIGNGAFDGCSGLTSIAIPSTINYIGAAAFANTGNLKTVTFTAGETPNAEELVFGETLTASGTVDSEKGAFYKSGITNMVLPSRPISIGAYTFGYCNSLESVTFGGALTKLGTGAFNYDYALTAVNGFENTGITELEDSIFSAGYDAAKTGSLASITLPETLERIGTSVFLNQSLTSVTIPASVKYIGQSSFASNKKLKTFEFAEGSQLEETGTYLFQNCSSLTSLVFPESVKTIGGSFLRGTSVKEFSVPALVEELANNFFAGAASLEKVTFPKNTQLKAIRSFTFQNTAIKSIAFPDTEWELSVEYDDIFSGCAQLKEVYIGSGVYGVDAAIAACPSINKITVSKDNRYYSTDANGNMLLDLNGLSIKAICGVIDAEDGVYEIPVGIKNIGDRVFKGQWKIKTVIVPGSVATIGDFAFENCLNLAEIRFNKNGTLTSIGSNVFYNCKSLKTVNLPESLLTMGKEAFFGSSVEQVYIPKKVTSMGINVFKRVSTLKTVTGMEGLTSIPDSAFEDTSIRTIEIPESVTSIGKSAFEGCGDLSSVSGMKSVKTLGTSAFDGCVSLTSFAMPKQVTQTPNYLFRNCISLSGVTGLEGITKIGTSSFEGTSALKELSFPSVTNVGDKAFASNRVDGRGDDKAKVVNPSGLTFISLPKVTALGKEAFEDCAFLTTVLLNDKLTKFKDATFLGCKALKNITLPSNLTDIGKVTFAYSGITAIDLSQTDVTKTVKGEYYEFVNEKSVKAAGVFEGCNNLSKVELNGNFVIGDNAFKDCVGITSFDFSKVKSIASYAFQNTGLRSVDLTGVATIKANAFRDSASLSSFTGIKDIPASAFANCGFETLDLNNVVKIGSSAFSSNHRLTSVSINDNEDVSQNNNKVSVESSAFANCENLETVTIGKGVTAIKQGAFLNDVKITSIDLPDTITEIGANAFKGTSLTTVKLPSGLTKLEPTSFACVTLTSYTGGSATFRTENGIVLKEGKMYAVPVSKECVDGEFTITAAQAGGKSLGGNLTIKKLIFADGVETIPDFVANTSMIEEVVIPASVKTIGTNAFQNCVNLKKVTFLTNGEGKTALTTIRYWAFSGCPALVDFTIPESVTWLDTGCLAGTAIKTAKIPEVCVTLGDSVFKGCAELTSVEILSQITSVGKDLFNGCVNLRTIATKDKNEEGVINLPDTVTNISASAFMQTAATKAIIPAGITQLTENDIFRDCANLTTVEFKGDIIKIGNVFSSSNGAGNTFKDCVKLNTIIFNGVTCENNLVIPHTLTFFGPGIFANTAFTSVTVPAEVTDLGLPECNSYWQGVFVDCAKLDSVFFNATNVKGSAVFKGSSVKTVKFGENVKNLPVKNMFEGCESLVSVDLKNLSAIPTSCFAGCTSLASVTIPKTVLAMNYYAFKGAGLTSVNFEEREEGSLLDLGTYTFQECASLESITLPAIKPVTITTSTYWFDGCTSLKSVTFSAKITAIGKYTFNGCESLKTIKFADTPEGVTGIYVPEGISIGVGAFSGLSAETVIRFAVDYYYTIGVWGEPRSYNTEKKEFWFTGCNATIKMGVTDPADENSGVVMNPYFA